MSRRRPTGRFFILLMLVLGVIVYLAVGRISSPVGKYEMVVSGSASDTRTMQAVIMRDEKVASMDGNSTMIFVADEGQYLRAGDEIAYIYSAGYSTKEMQKLETIRQDYLRFCLAQPKIPTLKILRPERDGISRRFWCGR